MKTFRAHLKSKSLIQFSKYLTVEKKEKESPGAYDKRVWREKAHYNNDGFVTIPATFFRNSLMDAAQYLSLKIVGEGQAKYTKYFRAGVIVIEGIDTNIDREKLEYLDVFGDSQGKRGGAGSRVIKRFPVIHEWEGKVDYIIVDEKITKTIFEKVLISCGQIIGIGTWRPINGGLYGRFEVLSVKEQ